jgi:hypothetical protein
MVLSFRGLAFSWNTERHAHRAIFYLFLSFKQPFPFFLAFHLAFPAYGTPACR